MLYDERQICIIKWSESAQFWSGDELQPNKGAMIIVPCGYAGVIEEPSTRIRELIEMAYSTDKSLTFEIDSAEDYAELDHHHCVCCRHVLKSDRRPLVLRFILAPTINGHGWGAQINHGSACWSCWRNLKLDDTDLWQLEVTDELLLHIETYARKYLLKSRLPPTSMEHLRDYIVDVVASMNANRDKDVVLKASTVPLPILWDFRVLLSETTCQKV